jgi:hypothetical protein
MRCAHTLLLIFGLLIAQRIHAQTSTPATQDEASASLLRLERASHLQSVCVLLNANGQYHLERHTTQKVRVFEGSITSNELRDIIRIVSDDQLYDLEQKQIPDLMMKADDEHLVLDIHRPGAWQQLLFPDSASREPFRETVGPLVQWLDRVNKRKMHELSEEAGRNNCLPPSKAEFAQRRPVVPSTTQPKESASNAPAPAPAISPVQETYTLQMYDNRLEGYRMEASCLLVSNSGKYHLVKQSRTYNKDIDTVVLDGTIAPPEQVALRAILDAPEMVNAPEDKEKGEVIMTGGSYLTDLSIPRGAKTQKVPAWRAYRIINHTMTRSVDEHGTMLLAPLRQWIQATINEKNAVPTANPPNPRCLPNGQPF